jgi:hypothetical protein
MGRMVPGILTGRKRGDSPVLIPRRPATGGLRHWNCLFGLCRFVKSRFQSRRECAKQTRKSRDLAQSVQSSERYVDQFGAEFILEGRDLLADCRLTDSAFLCDSGEAPFFNDSDERLHCIEFVHTNPHILLWNGCYARNNDSAACLLNSRTGQKEASSSPSCIPIRNSQYSPLCQICWQ